MNDELREILAKYRRMHDGVSRKIANPLGDTQSQAFRYGQLDIQKELSKTYEKSYSTKQGLESKTMLPRPG